MRTSSNIPDVFDKYFRVAFTALSYVQVLRVHEEDEMMLAQKVSR